MKERLPLGIYAKKVKLIRCSMCNEYLKIDVHGKMKRLHFSHFEKGRLSLVVKAIVLVDTQQVFFHFFLE